MAFQIQKITNAGTNNRIVARLGVQTTDIIGFSNLPEDKKAQVVSLYVITLTQRLLKCEEALEQIKKKLRDDFRRVHANLNADPRSAEVPYVVGLQGDAEDFLYAAKNYLRDLLGIFQIVHGCKFEDARAFVPDSKGIIEIVKWASEIFGANDHIVTLLKSEQDWTTELVRKRNAVEHPGGFSGTLSIHNIRVHSSQTGLVPPSWHRTGLPETDIVNDMTAFIHNLLTFAEDLLADVVMRNGRFKQIAIYEIPEERRDPKAPVRLTCNLSPELLATLAEASAKSQAKADASKDLVEIDMTTTSRST
ncbi:hypothetical protein [Mesorhizobium sp. CO1-1-8]|uniref:hypothetical protein n=1 Tax=Mesorhizobium sp. CO1-1-8 TaxID=2876631 RepID=UPI001CD0AFD5|nr:hypothetical protein [Mesorhizobium sp. CO1-1-8]MBZ9774384.1 hypothetical protein [Mesorhizobium sp. CO1-1-8]